MLEKILKNPYIAAGMIGFLILLLVGLVAGFSWVESLFGATALALVGVAVLRWQEEGV